MKKFYLTVATAITLCSSMMFSSCIGSFTLTHKLLDWNQSLGNKFLNELVFLAFWIVPVYEVSGIADLIVLNSIEFWSGTNPVAQGKSVIEGNDGRYLVDCDGKGYTITSLNDQSVIRLDFDVDQQTWSINTGDEKIPFMTFVDESHVKMITPDGDMQLVELSQSGYMAYQQIAAGQFLASK